MKKILLILSILNYCFAQSSDKIRFTAHWLPQAQFAGYYVAKEKGFYAKEGLYVELNHAGDKKSVEFLLQNNETDIISTFLSNAIKLRAENTPVINICQLSQKSALMFVAKKKTNIAEIKDFNNKKIGTWKADFSDIPLALLYRENITFEIIPIQHSINLFLNDGIDLMTVMWYNEYHKIISAGIEPDELSAFFLAEYGMDFPEDGIYCLENYYTENKINVDKFIKATLAGWQYAFENEEETLNIVIDYMKRNKIQSNKAHQRWMLNKIKDVYSNNGKFDKHSLRKESYESLSKLLNINPLGFSAFEKFYRGQ